jgi:hypothetical protein
VTITELQDMLRDFAHDRDWEQFHTPKNLAMALTGRLELPAWAHIWPIFRVGSG